MKHFFYLPIFLFASSRTFAQQENILFEMSMHADVIIEVPFHDVDTMNVVWHGHYLKYFEIPR